MRPHPPLFTRVAIAAGCWLGLAIVATVRAQGLDTAEEADLKRAQDLAKRASQITKFLSEDPDVSQANREIFKNGHGYFDKMGKAFGKGKDAIDVANMFLRLDKTLSCMEQCRDCLITDPQPHCRKGMAIGAYNLFQVAGDAMSKIPGGVVAKLASFYAEVVKGSSNVFLHVKEFTTFCRGHKEACEQLCATAEHENDIFCDVTRDVQVIKECAFLESEYPGQTATAKDDEEPSPEANSIIELIHEDFEYCVYLRVDCSSQLQRIDTAYDALVDAYTAYDDLGFLAKHMTPEGRQKRALMEAAVCNTIREIRNAEARVPIHVRQELPKHIRTLRKIAECPTS